MKTNLILKSQVPMDKSHTHIFWGKGDEVNYLTPGDTFKVKPLKLVNHLSGKLYQKKKRMIVYEFKVVSDVVKMHEKNNKDPRTLKYYKSLPQEAKDKYEWTLKHAVSFQQGQPVPCRWHMKVKCISANGILINNRFF